MTAEQKDDRKDIRCLDILCRVIDNYGDIGAAWRLARALREERPALKIRLIVDDLSTFQAIAPGLQPERDVQDFGPFTVIRWGFPWEGFSRDRPGAVIETFGCGYPPFYEEILFDPSDPAPRRIVDLEYLSAEPWTADYHLLPSPTRLACVKKSFFMPGFLPGTGGLLHDRHFSDLKHRFADRRLKAAARSQFLSTLDPALPTPDDRAVWLTVFTYEFDFSRIVGSLSAQGSPPFVIVASGRGAESFFSAWNRAGRPFPAVQLPFVPQETLDRVLLLSDFLIIRGEETFSRACLSGIPFLWQAYPLEAGDHLVKVEAFLEVLAPHFTGSPSFTALRGLYRTMNSGGSTPEPGISLDPVIENLEELAPGFESFSESVKSRGDLAMNLLSFFSDFV